jgi:ATP-dependent Clp protease ATP-binding subunit ClpC
MTIKEPQFSSFSQYYQHQPDKKTEQPIDEEPVQIVKRHHGTYRKFLVDLISDGKVPGQNHSDDEDESGESDNSLDDFVVPDDYPTETMDDSEDDAYHSEGFSDLSDSEKIPTRRSSRLSSGKKRPAKRIREPESTSPPKKRQKLKKNTDDRKWIRYKRSIEYSNLSAEYEENGSFNIVGRDSEVERIIRLVTQEDGGIRPLLVGFPNIGKCGVVKHLTETLSDRKGKNSLCARSVVMLDCQAVVSNWIASIDELQIAMVVRQKVTKLLREHANPIIFFRNIDAFLKYDESTDFLRSFFHQPINMVASISEEVGSEIVGKCQKVLQAYNFKMINIDECIIEHVPQIVSQQLTRHPFPYKNMKLGDGALQTAVKLADKHIKDRPFPTKAVNLIRETASYVFHSRDPVDGKYIVQPEDIAEVVHQETGIKVKELMSNSLDHLLRLEETLKGEIIGQDRAIKIVCQHVKRSRLELGGNDKPAGVFLFVGPTGVGKTLLAKKLASELYNDNRSLVRINMDGYSEPTALSKLIGTSAGYVGFGREGSLDGRISRKPHTIVLLDEIEKAHDEVINYFLGVFDTGFMENGSGKQIDCRHVIFIMTSNVGAKELLEISMEADLNEGRVMECVDRPLKNRFKPEFLNRIDDIIPFKGLKEEDCPRVAEVHLLKKRKDYAEKTGNKLCWSQPLVEYFSENSYEPKFGMRNLGKSIDKVVGDAITELVEREKCFITGEITIKVHGEKVIAEN